MSSLTQSLAQKKSTYGNLLGDRFDAIESNDSIDKREISTFKFAVDMLMNKLESGQSLPAARDFFDLIDKVDQQPKTNVLTYDEY